MTNIRKKVLFITYHFPPSGSTGAIRPVKFVKYLQDFGWNSVVLTVKNGFDFNIKPDKTYLKDIPVDAQIIRTNSFEPWNWYWALNNKLKNKYNQESLNISKSSLDRASLGSERAIKRIATKIKNSIIELTSVPDRYIGWLPFALVKALILLKNEDIKVIYSTSPPETCHLIGYVLKKITGKPWIADFRNLWTQNFRPSGCSKLKINIEKFMEHQVLHLADRVIHLSNGWKDQQISKYPCIEGKKFKVILNGFDPQDFVKKTPDLYQKFTIAYIGSLYAHETPQYFLEAIESLLEEKDDIKAHLQILFIGSIEGSMRPYFENLYKKKIVRIIDKVPHVACIEYLLNSHILLLIIGKHDGEKGCNPTKLYEYLYTQKPILALVPDGEVSDLIKNVKAGVVVDPEDTEEIKRNVYDLYIKYKQERLSVDYYPDPSIIRRVGRKYLTEKLASILNQLVENNQMQSS